MKSLKPLKFGKDRLRFPFLKRFEKVKLLISHNVFNKCIDFVNFMASLVTHITTKEPLTFDTSAIFDEIRENAPGNPEVDKPLRVAPNAISRVLLGHLSAKLISLTEPSTLKEAVNAALETRRNEGDVSAVTAPPEAADKLETFELIKKYIAALDLKSLAGFEDLIWRGGIIEPITNILQEINDFQIDLEHGTREQYLRTALEIWFDINFGELKIQPGPPRTQSGGRNRGWYENTYVEDGIKDLADFEFTVDLVSIDLADQPRLLDRLTPADSNDPALRAFEFVERTAGLPPRSRVGFRTKLYVKKLSVFASASTSPTHSAAALLLGLFCPHCYVLLWQHISGQLVIDDIEVDLGLFFANSLATSPQYLPTGGEDPRIELFIGAPVAGNIDASAFSFGPLWVVDPPLQALATAMIDFVVEKIAPSLVESFGKSLARRLELPPDLTLRLQPFLHLAGKQAPAGRNLVDILSEPEGYALTIAITEQGPGGPLLYPAEGEAAKGDATLLLRSLAWYLLTPPGGSVPYDGEIRLADKPDIDLEKRPVIDFWRDAPELGKIGPKPNFSGPPQVALATGATAPNWLGYYGHATTFTSVGRTFAVSNPSPDDPVAEVEVSMVFGVLVAEFEPVTYEVCEDWSRYLQWLDRGFPPLSPLDPGDPPPTWAEGILRVRKIGKQLITDFGPVITPAVLDSLAKAIDRRNSGMYGITTGEASSSEAGYAPDRLFAPAPGVSGTRGKSVPYTGPCTWVRTWDKKWEQNWLDARISIKMPLYFGLEGTFAKNPRFLPPLAHRVDTSDVQIGELQASAPEGPLAGLLEGANREWLKTIIANHALSTVLKYDEYVKNHPLPDLTYAYGPDTHPIQLEPEGFYARALLALHPDFWKPEGDQPAGKPPYITVDTFGIGPQPVRGGFAINFHLVTNLFDRIMAR